MRNAQNTQFTQNTHAIFWKKSMNILRGIGVVRVTRTIAKG